MLLEFDLWENNDIQALCLPDVNKMNLVLVSVCAAVLAATLARLN